MSLGTTKEAGGNVYKNVHIYHSGADTLSGHSRICYTYRESPETLLVTELQTKTRGSKYSSLFKVLVEKMNAADFPMDISRENTFKVNFSRIDEFCNITSEISKEFRENMYRLTVDTEFEHLSTGYFNKVYYQISKGSHDIDIENELMTDDQALKALDALIKTQDISGKTAVEVKKNAIHTIKTILSDMF